MNLNPITIQYDPLNQRVINVLDGDLVLDNFTGQIIIQVLNDIAATYSDRWCLFFQQQYETQAQTIPYGDHVFHKAYLLTSKIGDKEYFPEAIGYVEDSPFIKLAGKKLRPTWRMSSDAGIIHTSVLRLIDKSKMLNIDFDYWLNSIARSLRLQGLFCYRLDINDTVNNTIARNSTLYKFVKQHFKTRWTVMLLLSHFLFERKLSLFAFAKAQLNRSLNYKVNLFPLQKQAAIIDVDKQYDVLIPTIGRAEYLYNVLRDLAAQTILPKKVVIIEQNTDRNASTKLAYLKTEKWPFQIYHQLIHQTGACNARNIGLKQTSSPWVMLFDDDLRFESNIFSKIFEAIKITGTKVLNIACLQKNDQETFKPFKQWESFGSGCSMVHREVIDKCKFDMSLEHGYGEDVDYGIQIRNAGYDVIYAPQIQITHLKAPIGGFRQPVAMPWDSEKTTPRPSPQILYHRIKNTTNEQFKGYKLTLCLKLYPRLGTRNPWEHHKLFKQAWDLSHHYANKL